jgi:hypothetical protein
VSAEVIGLLAGLVFALLWLVNQDWFVALGPGVERGVKGVGGGVLVGHCCSPLLPWASAFVTSRLT